MEIFLTIMIKAMLSVPSREGSKMQKRKIKKDGDGTEEITSYFVICW